MYSDKTQFTKLLAVLDLSIIGLVIAILVTRHPLTQNQILTTVIQPGSQVAQVSDVTNGLSAWWKLDETSGSSASDASGNGNTGTLTGTTLPTWTTGKVSGALSFDGVTSSVSLGNGAALNPGSGSFSYGLWVNATANTSEWDEPFWKGGSSGTRPGYDVELGNNYWTANISDGTIQKQVLFSSTPLMNQWVHLFVVVDRTVGLMKVYVNGTPTGNTSIAGLGSLSGTSAAVLSGTYAFKGMIDDVRIYNRALPDTEVANVYAAATQPVPQTPVISAIAASGLTSSSATITWTTDQAADSQVEYGLIAPSPNYSSNSALTSSLLTAHMVVLSGLQANTVYHFRVDSKNATGQLAKSSDLTFATQAVVVVPPASGAATYYVSPTGSDTNPGSLSAPWKTLQQAANVANPGDTTIVRNGIYTTTGSLLIDMLRSGASSNMITFKSENKWGAVLDGSNNATLYGIKLENGTSHIRFQDFEMRNFGNAAILANGPNNNDLQFVGNNVHDIGRICTDSNLGQVGIYMKVTNTVTIEKNIFANIGRLANGENGCVASSVTNWNHDQGLYIDGVSNVLIKNNIFYGDNHGWPIQVYGSNGVSTNLSIVNNTFAGLNPQRTGQLLLSDPGLTNGVIENNIFYQPSTAGVRLSGAPVFTNVRIDHNMTYGGVIEALETNSGTAPGVTFASNSDNTDPKFVNPASFDFHLQSTSPAIDVGVLFAQISDDFSGSLRPLGLGYDLGAYEYPPVVTVPVPPLAAPPPPPPIVQAPPPAMSGGSGSATPVYVRSGSAGGTSTLATSTPAVTQIPSVFRLPTAFQFPHTLKIYTRSQDVRNLQIFLNDHGYTVSTSGGGSYGDETTYYGPATIKALSRFQALNTISPAIGNFGPITLKLVNQMLAAGK